MGQVGSARSLRGIKALHTVLWAMFAASIILIPVVTAIGDLHAGLLLSLFVWVEVIMLVINDMRCPLTSLAARYTDDRADNFDIFLPVGWPGTISAYSDQSSWPPNYS